MDAGMWIALGVVLVCSAILWWFYTSNEPEVPDGVRIEKIDGRWTYFFIDDTRAMNADINGYFTRAAAIRAARTEMQRLAKRTQA